MNTIDPTDLQHAVDILDDCSHGNEPAYCLAVSVLMHFARQHMANVPASDLHSVSGPPPLPRVLTADDPEPPIGSVVMSEGWAWQRTVSDSFCSWRSHFSGTIASWALLVGRNGSILIYTPPSK